MVKFGQITNKTRLTISKSTKKKNHTREPNAAIIYHYYIEYNHHHHHQWIMIVNYSSTHKTDYYW